MLAPFLPRFAPSDSKPDSWWTRVHENLRQLTAPGGLSPTSANGAPIHVLKLGRSSAAGQAQTLSLVTHVFALAVLVLFLAGPGFDGKRPISPGSTPLGVLTVPSRILRALGAHASSGSGGDQTPIPLTHGNLPHVSSIQLVRPSLPQNHRADLPVPPTILDSNAAPVLISIDNIGLPWMSNVTNSAGPAKATPSARPMEAPWATPRMDRPAMATLWDLMRPRQSCQPASTALFLCTPKKPAR